MLSKSIGHFTYGNGLVALAQLYQNAFLVIFLPALKGFRQAVVINFWLLLHRFFQGRFQFFLFNRL